MENAKRIVDLPDLPERPFEAEASILVADDAVERPPGGSDAECEQEEQTKRFHGTVLS